MYRKPDKTVRTNNSKVLGKKLWRSKKDLAKNNALKIMKSINDLGKNGYMQSSM